MHTIVPLTSELLEHHRQTYLETLATLSPTGTHTVESLLSTYEKMTVQWTVIFVAIDETSWIIGTCSVLIEHKFNRGWSKVAHLEDLAVHLDAQGQGVGTALLDIAKKFALQNDCYKIILNCDSSLEVRYAKYWFQKTESTMRIDFPSE